MEALDTQQPARITAQNTPNGIPALRERRADGRLGWLWPLTMNFIRFPLLIGGFFIALAIYQAAGNPNAQTAALLTSNFYITFVADIPCVLLLIWLTRREGIRLRDLVGRGRNIALDLLWGLLLAIPLLILFVLANTLAALIVYGPSAFAASNASASTAITTYGVPTWIFWWSAIVLPFSAGVAEELTYRGYALPRFVALFGRAWPAVLLMSLGFATQHIAFALNSPDAALTRFLGILFIAPAFALIYLWQKRLLPLIVAHVLIDIVGLGLPALYVALNVR